MKVCYDSERTGANSAINTPGTPTPSFPLDPYHARYQVLDPFVDVVSSGRKRTMVLVCPLIVMQYGASGHRHAEYIALTTEAQTVFGRGADAPETKVCGGEF